MDRLTFSDERLMTLARDGDQQAFQALVRRFGASMLTLASRMLGSGAAAEEAFVDAVAKVWLGRRTYDSGRPVRPWLLAITANACRQHARTRRRFWGGGALSGEHGGSGQEARQDPVLPELDESADRIQSALELLPLKQRETLVLRVWGELEYDHIAAALGVSPETVRSNMHHAIARMRRLLADSDHSVRVTARRGQSRDVEAAARPRSGDQ